MNYAKRVQALEHEGCTTSDARGIADIEQVRGAAPALLEACRAALKYCDKPVQSVDMRTTARELLIDAINKATGC